MINVSQPFGAMLLTGDALRSLRRIPDASVQCCVTSPPYYRLRDYGHDGQIGLEQTPDEYVAALVEVFREVKRVLRDDGVVWLNLGDSYANWVGPARTRGHFGAHETCVGTKVPRGLKEKDLIGIPWRVAFALQADGWYLRQDIIWHKPNPMPESVTDRCTKAHEYIFLLTKKPRYYFDSEAIKEPAVTGGATSLGVSGARGSARKSEQHGVNGRNVQEVNSEAARRDAPGGAFNNNPRLRITDGKRNRRSVWTITTKPFAGAHFATFPPDLVEPCILAGSRPGDVVLDPFGGAGTTALVSRQHGRRAVYIELNPEYVEIARERLTGLQ